MICQGQEITLLKLGNIINPGFPWFFKENKNSCWGGELNEEISDFLVNLDYLNACFVLFLIFLIQIVPPWKFASPFGCEPIF